MPIELLDPASGVLSDAPSVQMPIGASAAAGDLRLFRVTASSSRTFPTVTGWPKLYDQVVSRRVTLYYRVLAPGDTNVTLTPTASPPASVHNMSWAAITLRGWDDSQTLTSSTSTSATAATAVVAPGVTAPGDGVLLCWFDVTRVSGGANTGSWGIPAGMTSRTSALAPIATGYNILLASEPRAAGPTGTRTATAASSGVWSATSMFVAEAVAPAGPEPGRFFLVS